MTPVGLVSVLNSGAVVLRWMGDTRSDPYSLWTMGRLRKEARCVASDEILFPGSLAFRSVGNQDYRSRRVSRRVVWAMIGMAVDQGAIEPTFEGWDDVSEWFEEEFGV